MKLFLILFAINLFGFMKYIDYTVTEVSYKKQLITDFFCPVGSFLGRLLFHFKIKENPSGYILGIFFQIFIIIIYITIT